MFYIQSTDIKSHGDLKSPNCLVDSRWVLKIADYGLPTFKEKQAKTYPSEHAYYRGTSTLISWKWILLQVNVKYKISINILLTVENR